MKNRNLIKKAVESGPSKRQFDRLLQSFKEELKPETFLENLIVSKIAVDYLRLYKILGYESKQILKSDETIRDHIGYGNDVNGFINYKNSIEKSINASCNLLKVLKRDRLGPKVWR